MEGKAVKWIKNEKKDGRKEKEVEMNQPKN